MALLAPPFESVPPLLYGGTERVVHELARGLHSQHIETTVFASADSTVPGRLIPVTPSALRLRNPAIHDPAPHLLDMLATVATHADDFDIIHNHNDLWMLPLHRMTKTPMVTTLHGRLDIPDIILPLRSFKEARYISISDSQRDPVRTLSWISTIHHGVDLRRFQFHPKPGNYLAFLGRISHEKRPDLAIEIAKKADIPLKIAAKIEKGRDQDYFDALIRPHIDGRQVEFIGEISESEKSEFLGNALGLVFPIDWPEPFGLVMIESLAFGTPVLARPLGSVPEILKDGVTGYMSLDIHELARRARELEHIDRSRCRRWVSERFSMERMVEDHIHVYKKAIRDRRHLIHSL
ncbi:MAG: glycosyltransferase family 4 protein [Bdellovibrionales bacterium]|nr:glycosyltransferase family 4 protein [Bdellovibrionales bacterium]